MAKQPLLVCKYDTSTRVRAFRSLYYDLVLTKPNPKSPSAYSQYMQQELRIQTGLIVIQMAEAIEWFLSMPVHRVSDLDIIRIWGEGGKLDELLSQIKPTMYIKKDKD